MEVATDTKFGTKVPGDEDDARTSNTRIGERARDTTLDDKKASQRRDVRCSDGAL